MSPAYLTADDVRARLRDACHRAGGQKAYAEKRSIPTTSVWDALHKTPGSPEGRFWPPSDCAGSKLSMRRRSTGTRNMSTWTTD